MCQRYLSGTAGNIMHRPRDIGRKLEKRANYSAIASWFTRFPTVSQHFSRALITTKKTRDLFSDS